MAETDATEVRQWLTRAAGGDAESWRLLDIDEAARA
jgi:hypothetical protein